MERFDKMDDIKNVPQKPVVLLVDDNAEILEFLRLDLNEQYTILTANNGRDALAIIDDKFVDLIVSDVMMPFIDGFQLCQSIKSNILTSHIPVILLTAKNTLQHKMEGLSLGADAYIDKPFSPEHLAVQIANLLVNRIKIKAHYAQSPLVQIKSMAYSKADEHFLDMINKAIYEHMQDEDLDVEHLARYLNMSRPTLYRKISALSNLSPAELINIARLKNAAILLREGLYNINEVAVMVGYSSPNHFGRNFLKQFGVTPSAYLKEK